MRPTKLIAGSNTSFADAAKELINKAIEFSGEVKSLRILEDRPAANSRGEAFRLRAHIMKKA